MPMDAELRERILLTVKAAREITRDREYLSYTGDDDSDATEEQRAVASLACCLVIAWRELEHLEHHQRAYKEIERAAVDQAEKWRLQSADAEALLSRAVDAMFDALKGQLTRAPKSLLADYQRFCEGRTPTTQQRLTMDILRPVVTWLDEGGEP